MNKFQPHINPVYPPDNNLIFEEWFSQNYKGCNTDRELLPFFPTSYWVNNNYAQDLVAKKEAQDYIDSLPNKKYFIICQYDDGCLIDWKGKDVLEFNMSKTNGVMMPLLCQPHPYKFISEKKWFASFVGSRTHPIRDKLEKLKEKEGYYISFDRIDIETYCRILHESIFSLCPRGYGINSFRVTESLQYGSIPVIISDQFVLPYDLGNYDSFVCLIKSNHVENVDEILKSIPDEEVLDKLSLSKDFYDRWFTYESNLKHIINTLEVEFNNWEQIRKDVTAL